MHLLLASENRELYRKYIQRKASWYSSQRPSESPESPDDTPGHPMKSRIEPLQKNTHTHIQNLTNCFFFFRSKRKTNKAFIPDIPALRQPEITSRDRDLGPRVPTIFVIAGKKLYKIESNSDPRTMRVGKKA